ncbi:hypothetical protein QA612_13615 [Evansella sp. AB-P1]|uniref:hypothetical protein n=1 Tax=Evansella sp. AB-P1 TaxID=3037653 RepID=UPI00241ECC63|nr:hypothetical protein [Evansella sp. AB-P1]MDG5788519.1 hypothetical protein [Evansella sp. AB-P1]
MYKKIVILFITILSFSIVAGCLGNEENEGFSDDKMIGSVIDVKHEEEIVMVNTSEWEYRDVESNDEGELYLYYAELSADSLIKKEDGSNVSLQNIKVGQKVLIHPPRIDKFEGHAEEIILLDMTYEEKYEEVLSHLKDILNIVVIHEKGQSLSNEIITVGMDIEQLTAGSFIEYSEDYVVDYKEAFDLESLPVILVSNSEEVLLKTTDVEEVNRFFEELE